MVKVILNLCPRWVDHSLLIPALKVCHLMHVVFCLTTFSSFKYSKFYAYQEHFHTHSGCMQDDKSYWHFSLINSPWMCYSRSYPMLKIIFIISSIENYRGLWIFGSKIFRQLNYSQIFSWLYFRWCDHSTK